MWQQFKKLLVLDLELGFFLKKPCVIHATSPENVYGHCYPVVSSYHCNKGGCVVEKKRTTPWTTPIFEAYVLVGTANLII